MALPKRPQWLWQDSYQVDQGFGMRSYGGHSMSGDLHRVIVCSAKVAGWNDARAERWEELGYFHPPIFSAAEAQYRGLTQVLAAVARPV
jgi:hypothetical protein